MPLPLSFAWISWQSCVWLQACAPFHGSLWGLSTWFPCDKNSPRCDYAAAAAFNLVVDDLTLYELPLVDRRYTWSNCRDDPTLVCLGRVFINLPWSQLLFNSTLQSAERTTDDHVPLVIEAALPLGQMGWVDSLLATGKMVELLDGVLGRWIKCKNGLRQGDPLSPNH